LVGETEVLGENLPQNYLFHYKSHMFSLETTYFLVGFEFFAAVVMKCPISCLLQAGFLLGLFFKPENGCDMFLRNVV
jgi:hypothetical protein